MTIGIQRIKQAQEIFAGAATSKKSSATLQVVEQSIDASIKERIAADGTPFGTEIEISLHEWKTAIKNQEAFAQKVADMLTRPEAEKGYGVSVQSIAWDGWTLSVVLQPPGAAKPIPEARAAKAQKTFDALSERDKLETIYPAPASRAYHWHGLGDGVAARAKARPEEVLSKSQMERFKNWPLEDGIPPTLLEYVDTATNARLAFGVVSYRKTGDADSDARGAFREKVWIIDRNSFSTIGPEALHGERS